MGVQLDCCACSSWARCFPSSLLLAGRDAVSVAGGFGPWEVHAQRAPKRPLGPAASPELADGRLARVACPVRRAVCRSRVFGGAHRAVRRSEETVACPAPGRTRTIFTGVDQSANPFCAVPCFAAG
ncbi:unnamed protein product [Prorocentrum cordatum]|uniref:Uncharacterized protein n=1 Tax=Prorocentrum cordatum TaxID=2364126 RepID=A0ABN9VPU1_9DINO|nr:unnamed protein product [Polarella glacialis]